MIFSAVAIFLHLTFTDASASRGNFVMKMMRGYERATPDLENVKSAWASENERRISVT